jgi:hypothetical protein
MMELKARPSLKQELRLKDAKALVGCEIGVQRGLNALWMCERLDIVKLYLIDPYASYPNKVRERGRSLQGFLSQEEADKIRAEAEENLREHAGKIVWLVGKSAEMVSRIPDDSLDFVYVDGDHSYNACLTDLMLFYPKVKTGGLIAGHDYGRDVNGVQDAVDAFWKMMKLKPKKLHVKGMDFWFRKRD